MMKSSVQLPGRAIKQICFSMIISALLSSNVKAQTDSIKDIHGNTYKIVAIGDQWWMAENLKVSQYANGDEIPHLTDDNDWANLDAGAYCYYEDNTENIGKYGNLYNWYTVNDSRGICPEGWHVPADEEWMIMEKYLGMSAAESDRMTAWRGTDEGEILKSESFGGNNSSGFSALGTGYRDPAGIYKALGTDNDYWTSTAYNNEGNTEGILHGLLNTNPKVVRNFHVPGYGFCVRCIGDNAVHLMNLSGLEAGTYILKLEGPGTTRTSSFIKM